MGHWYKECSLDGSVLVATLGLFISNGPQRQWI